MKTQAEIKQELETAGIRGPNIRKMIVSGKPDMIGDFRLDDAAALAREEFNGGATNVTFVLHSAVNGRDRYTVSA